jgi:predicted nucleotidyltransferase component of viral defense system
MIQAWLEDYQAQTAEEVKQALREIVQETALAGLYRAGFFEKAAFYGGTALRIFYKLPRYSEDLDFSLLKPDKDFSLAPYLNAIVVECEAIGLQVEIHQKTRSQKTAIDSAFLKADSKLNELRISVFEQMKLNGLSTPIQLKIKIEVDTNPPLGFETEDKLLLKPFSCYIKCFKAEDLFAGKMHALLFRKWKNRVKGRDWYDFEWYIKKGIPLHLNHFIKRARQSGDIKSKITRAEFIQLVEAKIDAVSMDRVKEDITVFINKPDALKIWSKQYFKDLIGQLKIV